MGVYAGFTGQGNDNISLGPFAGYSSQGTFGGVGSIAIGNNSGYVGQLDNSIAIGSYAGYSGQGNQSISIGSYSGNKRCV